MIPDEVLAVLDTKFAAMLPHLDERQRRLYLASEAEALGHGLVTTGRRKGKRPEKLRTQGGWSKNSPVFWEYVGEGEKWEDNATEGIGL